MSRFNLIQKSAAACLLVLMQAARADVPQTLTLPDLANHPERWPASIVVREPMQFGGGNSLKAGQQVPLMELQGTDVVIDAGKGGMVAIGPDQCDLLDAANKMWAALTPAQRAVDTAALLNDASLWPDKIKSHVVFDLTTGKSIPAGQELVLSFIDRTGVTVYSADPEAHLTARLVDTDVFTRAREVALIEPAQRKSRIVESLRGRMIDSSGKPYEDSSFEQAKLLVLYHGASWCQPCHKFSPTLVKFFGQNAAANPRMFAAMLSADDKDPDVLQYMTEGKMPWPVITKSSVDKVPVLKGLFGNFIPQIVVLDHYGKVLASSDVNGQYDNVTPMRTLAKLVKSGAAK